MAENTFVYAIHIGATPEKVWEALTSNEFWQQYWGGEWIVESDWKAGSPLKYYSGDGKFFSQGEIIKSDPPKTLTYTWPNPPEEQGDTPPELLTWQVTQSGPGTVMLKLIHERVTEGYLEGVSQGWVSIFSNLKTLLETGKTLAFFPHGQGGGQ